MCCHSFSIVLWNKDLFLYTKQTVCHLVLLYVCALSHFSHVWLFVTPWIAARQASLSITNSRNLLRLISIESVMPSSHLILCRPLLLLPPIPPIPMNSMRRTLEWVAVSSFRRSSPSWNLISCIVGGFFTQWSPCESPSSLDTCDIFMGRVY